jgi:hypothetical protein
MPWAPEVTDYRSGAPALNAEFGVCAGVWACEVGNRARGRRYFVGRLSEDFQDGNYAQLLEDFVRRYHFIGADERSTVETRLVT